MRRTFCRVRSTLTIFMAAALWCAAAGAQNLVHFDLPAQPLAQSLVAIGAATNTDVGFRASQVEGLLAPPLKADLTVDGALTRVLAGTGLRPKHLDDHTIVIAAADASTADSRERKLLWPKHLQQPSPATRSRRRLPQPLGIQMTTRHRRPPRTEISRRLPSPGPTSPALCRSVRLSIS